LYFGDSERAPKETDFSEEPRGHREEEEETTTCPNPDIPNGQPPFDPILYTVSWEAS